MVDEVKIKTLTPEELLRLATRMTYTVGCPPGCDISSDCSYHEDDTHCVSCWVDKLKKENKVD